MSPPGLLRQSRVRGMLAGGAVGDALGAPVEFSSLEEIHLRYGPEGITGYAFAYGAPGRWTDDTQMTLFTAEGLITARETGAEPIEALWDAYRRWYRTQTTAGPFGEGLSALASMHSRRAPGNTCLTSCAAPQPGTTARAINDSKGCGGVMRVAPVGAVSNDPFHLANDAAALTHGHPSGWLAAGSLAVIISRLMQGADRQEAVGAGLESVAEHPQGGEVRLSLRLAIELADAAPREPTTIEDLGAGWVAEEALSIAAYCFLAADDFDQAVILGANHSGDSDSTASIAGQLYGTWAGVEAIGPRWTDELELAEVIMDLADRL